MKALLFATDFAAKKHTHQRRKNKEKTPYINHAIGVANTLAQCGVTEVEILEGALLHDTIEDTECTFEELLQNFSQKTVDYVREVTDDKTLSKAQRKKEQVKHASTASLGARLIKLSDKLYNVNSVCKCPPPWWHWKRIQGKSFNVVVRSG